MDEAADIAAEDVALDLAPGRATAAAARARAPGRATAAAAGTAPRARLAADLRVHQEATLAPAPAPEVDHAQASAAQ